MKNDISENDKKELIDLVKAISEDDLKQAGENLSKNYPAFINFGGYKKQLGPSTGKETIKAISRIKKYPYSMEDIQKSIKVMPPEDATKNVKGESVILKMVPLTFSVIDEQYFSVKINE